MALGEEGVLTTRDRRGTSDARAKWHEVLTLDSPQDMQIPAVVFKCLMMFYVHSYAVLFGGVTWRNMA